MKYLLLIITALMISCGGTEEKGICGDGVVDKGEECEYWMTYGCAKEFKKLPCLDDCSGFDLTQCEGGY